MDCAPYCHSTFGSNQPFSLISALLGIFIEAVGIESSGPRARLAPCGRDSDPVGSDASLPGGLSERRRHAFNAPE